MAMASGASASIICLGVGLTLALHCRRHQLAEVMRS